MKSARHSKILELIEYENIDTQEDLVCRLKDEGFDVTQATASRDIRELRLVKVLHSNGEYRYAIVDNSVREHKKKLSEMFKRALVSIAKADAMIVVKTISGSANIAAEAIDSLSISGIAGCIAGDNTIFVAVYNKDEIDSIISSLRAL